MSIWTIFTFVQVVGVIANSILILRNYVNYQRYREKVYIALIAWSSFWLLWSIAWGLWDAGVATGKW